MRSAVISGDDSPYYEVHFYKKACGLIAHERNEEGKSLDNEKVRKKTPGNFFLYFVKKKLFNIHRVINIWCNVFFLKNKKKILEANSSLN